MMSVWLLGGPLILDNPDFETGSYNPWAVTGVPGPVVSLTVSSNEQYTGNYSGLVICTSYAGAISSMAYLHQEDLTLEAGVSYFVRFASRVASAYGNFNTFGKQCKITDYSISSIYAAIDFDVTTSWKVFAFGWTQPTNTNSARINIYMPTFTGLALAEAHILIDDIVIYRAVEINAGYDYKFDKIQRRYNIRSRSGELHSYILPNVYRKFTFPGIDVDSAGRCTIASFWINDDTCYLVENDTNPLSMYAVKIIGEQEPFQSFSPPYGLSRYVGELKLEAVDAE